MSGGRGQILRQTCKQCSQSADGDVYLANIGLLHLGSRPDLTSKGKSGCRLMTAEGDALSLKASVRRSAPIRFISCTEQHLAYSYNQSYKLKRWAVLCNGSTGNECTSQQE